MENQHRESVCQCLRCGHIFSSSQKRRSDIYPFGACPVCGGNYTTLRFADSADEYYVNCLANKYSR